MISNEQRAHDMAVALMAKHNDGSDPVKAYQDYINILLPILKEIDKDFPSGIAEHPVVQKKTPRNDEPRPSQK